MNFIVGSPCWAATRAKGPLHLIAAAVRRAPPRGATNGCACSGRFVLEASEQTPTWLHWSDRSVTPARSWYGPHYPDCYLCPALRVWGEPCLSLTRRLIDHHQHSFFVTQYDDATLR
jgi:hypothetical protein